MDTATYDPTNVGNEPGDGPLRSGGKGLETDLLGEDNRPSKLSPLAKQQADAVVVMRDVCAGAAQIRYRGEKYLPQAPGEKPPSYKDRLNRSVFFNATQRTVEGLAGLVFRKDPVLSDDPETAVPDQIREHWENIDLQGTHGDVFCRNLFADALTVGHAALLVEYPTVRSDLNREEERQIGARPYWIPLAKDNIISWRTENEYGKQVLTQFVYKEVTWAPRGMFGERRIERYRVFYRKGGTVGFELIEIMANNEMKLVGAGTYPTQTEIPIVEVPTNGSIGLFNSTPPLLDMAYLNIAHYQQWSDYAYAIHKTNVPFLFGAGIRERTNPDGTPRGPVTIGPNTAVFEADPNAKMMYVSHGGQSLAESKQALDDLKGDMGVLGLSLLLTPSRMAEKPETIRLRKSSSESPLAASARMFQDAIENALQLHANYLRLEQGGSVEINRDFEGLLIEAEVMGAFAQLVNAGLPPGPVLAALKRGGRLAEDADLDELEMEWLMGQQLNAALPSPNTELMDEQ